METIEEIKKRIESATDLRDIVRTMKTLSAVNIRHYERAVESVGEYYRTVELGLRAVLREGAAAHPSVKGGGRPVAVVFGTDQGLCGPYNDRVVEKASRELAREDGPEILAVGSRCAVLLDSAGLSPAETFPVPGSLPAVTPMVQEVLLRVYGSLGSEGMGSVTLYHNRPVSGTSYEAVSARLLPLDSHWLEEVRSRGWPGRGVAGWTMEREKLLSALVRQYVFVSVYRAFAESMAGENAARLASMQAAERNIEERIDEYSAAYRRERQSAITGELLDIVGGFEAIESAGT